MTTRTLFHGSDGDGILQIIKTRQMRPDSEGKIYFSERRYDSVFMHGGDLKRKLTFAVKVQVQVPPSVRSERKATPGVDDTLVLLTNAPIQAEILDLYVRKPRAAAVEEVHGERAIERYLVNAA